MAINTAGFDDPPTKGPIWYSEDEWTAVGGAVAGRTTSIGTDSSAEYDEEGPTWDDRVCSITEKLLASIQALRTSGSASGGIGSLWFSFAEAEILTWYLTQQFGVLPQHFGRAGKMVLLRGLEQLHMGPFSTPIHELVEPHKTGTVLPGHGFPKIEPSVQSCAIRQHLPRSTLFALGLRSSADVGLALAQLCHRMEEELCPPDAGIELLQHGIQRILNSTESIPYVPILRDLSEPEWQQCGMSDLNTVPRIFLLWYLANLMLLVRRIFIHHSRTYSDASIVPLVLHRIHNGSVGKFAHEGVTMPKQMKIQTATEHQLRETQLYLRYCWQINKTIPEISGVLASLTCVKHEKLAATVEDALSRLARDDCDVTPKDNSRSEAGEKWYQ